MDSHLRNQCESMNIKAVFRANIAQIKEISKMSFDLWCMAIYNIYKTFTSGYAEI
jgi:hypothetical protein